MTKRQSSGIERTINSNRADDRPESTGESSGIEQTILPYRAGGTFVFSLWNFYFILVELLFRAENTDGSSARNSPNESIIPLHPYLKVPVFPAKSDSNSS